MNRDFSAEVKFRPEANHRWYEEPAAAQLWYGIDNHGMHATVLSDGALEFAIEANPAYQMTHGFANEMFRSVVRKFSNEGVQVNQIDGVWRRDKDEKFGMQSNIDAYFKNRADGMSPQSAALHTFTGRMASDFGFTQVSNVSWDLSFDYNGALRPVFSRPGPSYYSQWLPETVSATDLRSWSDYGNMWASSMGPANVGRQADMKLPSAFGVCFAAGTPVHTLDGIKAIEEVVLGDMVMAAPDAGTAKLVRPRQVLHLFRNPPTALLEVVVGALGEASEILAATHEHPFWVQGKGWVAARQLLPGDQLKATGRDGIAVLAVNDTGRSEPTYNFEVDTDHNYFVGYSGVLVHNASILGDGPIQPEGVPSTPQSALQAGGNNWAGYEQQVGGGFFPGSAQRNLDFSQFVKTGGDLNGSNSRAFSLWVEPRGAPGPHFVSGDVRDGVMDFNIMADSQLAQSKGYGNEMFMSVIRALGSEGTSVDSIQGLWWKKMATNWNQYHAALNQGYSPQKAAFATFTGSMASQLGLLDVRNVYTADAYARATGYVKPLFSRPGPSYYSQWLPETVSAKDLRSWSDYGNMWASSMGPANVGRRTALNFGGY